MGDECHRDEWASSRYYRLPPKLEFRTRGGIQELRHRTIAHQRKGRDSAVGCRSRYGQARESLIDPESSPEKAGHVARGW